MALKKRESKLFQRIKNNIKNIDFTRIESTTIQGIPDVNGCGNGVEFWLELKSTPDNIPVLSKFQIAWCFKRTQHGGRVFILHEALLQRQLKLYRVSCVDYKNILHLCYSLPNPVPRSRWADLADQLLGVH